MPATSPRLSAGRHAIPALALGLLASVAPAPAHAALSYGWVDVANLQRVVGWALDPDRPDLPISVHAYVDGVFVAAGVAAGCRPDVGCHAFDLSFPATSGREVRVYAIGINAFGAIDNENPLVGQPRVVNSSPIGYVDVADGTTIAGWATDPDFDGPISVMIIVDNVPLDTITANACRPDVGCHGFHYAHTSFGAGAHDVKIKAYSRNSNGQADLLNVYLPGQSRFVATCAGLRAHGESWCQAVPHYFTTRLQDALILSTPQAMAEINRSYGGTLFRFTGADRSVNLIDENGGAAVQLSVWGTGANDEHLSLPWCQGWTSTAPFNPIQAQQTNCSWDSTQNASNDVTALSSCGWNCWDTEQRNPVNFTKSTTMQGMLFKQHVDLQGARLRLVHTVDYSGSIRMPVVHPQEVPAVHLAVGTNAVVYYQSGTTRLPVGTSTAGVQSLAIPPSPAANTGGDPRRLLTEITDGVISRPYAPSGRLQYGWYSVCGNSGNGPCVTVVIKTGRYVLREIDFQAFDGATYATPIAYFAMEPGFKQTFETYLFPYRFDATPPGENKTVLEQIYAVNPTP